MVEDFPGKCRTRGNAEFLQFLSIISKMKNPTHNASIEEALADLSIQEHPNVLATARKYYLVESTLRRRWKGKTTSHPVCASEFKQRLTDV